MRPPLGRLFLVALTLALGMALGRDAVPAAGVAPQPGTMVFRSDQGNVVLAIDLEPLSPEAGGFVVTVEGVGSYVSVDRATIEPNGVRNVKARYDGPVRFAPTADLPRMATGRLSGEFLTDKGRAVAIFEVEGRRYRISTHGVPAEDLGTVLPAFETAMLGSDWAALHALLAPDLQAAMPAAEFSASASAQSAALGQTAELRRLSVGAPAASAFGMSYAVARYEIGRLRADGSRTTTTYDAYFIYEDGAWRLWFTAAR